jgi:hypothetical protein
MHLRYPQDGGKTNAIVPQVILAQPTAMYEINQTRDTALYAQCDGDAAMLTVSVFSVWIAAAFLLISGIGREIFAPYHLRLGLIAGLMAGVAAAALVSSVSFPAAVNAGAIWWSASIGVLCKAPSKSAKH